MENSIFLSSLKTPSLSPSFSGSLQMTTMEEDENWLSWFFRCSRRQDHRQFSLAYPQHTDPSRITRSSKSPYAIIMSHHVMKGLWVEMKSGSSSHVSRKEKVNQEKTIISPRRRRLWSSSSLRSWTRECSSSWTFSTMYIKSLGSFSGLESVHPAGYSFAADGAHSCVSFYILAHFWFPLRSFWRVRERRWHFWMLHEIIIKVDHSDSSPGVSYESVIQKEERDFPLWLFEWIFALLESAPSLFIVSFPWKWHSS